MTTALARIAPGKMWSTANARVSRPRPLPTTPPMASTIQPKPFRRAIVADDGKVGGDAALSVAPFVLDKLSYSMTLVHAIDVPEPRDMAGSPDEIVNYRRALAERAADWLDGRVRARFGDDTEKVDRLVQLGEPSRIVRRAAEDSGADLIVVGPHRKEHLLDFGGTQRAIFAGSGCHVWSQPFEAQTIRRIFAPTDLSTRSHRAMGVARDVARTLGLPLHVFCTSPPPAFADAGMMYGDVPSPAYVVDALHETARKRFDDYMAEVDTSDVSEVTQEFLIGDPVVGINEQRLSTDLVVMGTRGHTGISAALFGGTTYAVLKEGAGPVLAVDVG